MLRSLWATVQDGRIQPLEPVDLPEGARLVLTVLGDDDEAFWTVASQSSLDAIWGNTEDDVYARLLEE